MVEAIHFFQNSCPLFSFDNSLVKEDSKRYENAVIHGDNEWIFHVPCFEPGMEENRMELILGNFFHTKSTAVLTFNEFLKASAFAFAIFPRPRYVMHKDIHKFSTKIEDLSTKSVDNPRESPYI